jgi:hypothetical protein
MAVRGALTAHERNGLLPTICPVSILALALSGTSPLNNFGATFSPFSS